MTQHEFTSAVQYPTGLTAVQSVVHKIMYNYGCPAHRELIHDFVATNWFKVSQSTIDKALYYLVNQGIMRRVRRGVYSARGAERD